MATQLDTIARDIRDLCVAAARVESQLAHLTGQLDEVSAAHDAALVRIARLEAEAARVRHWVAGGTAVAAVVASVAAWVLARVL